MEGKSLAEAEPPMRVVIGHSDLAAGQPDMYLLFARASRDELDEAIACIHQRAEMVTPLLHKILQYRSSSRWDQHTEAP